MVGFHITFLQHISNISFYLFYTLKILQIVHMTIYVEKFKFKMTVLLHSCKKNYDQILKIFPRF